MKYLFPALFLILFSCSNASNKSLKNVKPCKLEFFETYAMNDIQTAWSNACAYVKENDTLVRYMELSLQQLEKRGLHKMVIQSNPNGIGLVLTTNRKAVDSMFRIPGVQALFPKDLRFLFSEKEVNINGDRYFELYAIKMPEKNEALISGKDIQEATVNVDDQNGIISVMLEMTDDGATRWAKMTEQNVGRSIAIVVDGQVLSCPIVQMAITDGKTQISGNFTVDEANLLAARINAGK